MLYAKGAHGVFRRQAPPLMGDWYFVTSSTTDVLKTAIRRRRFYFKVNKKTAQAGNSIFLNAGIYKDVNDTFQSFGEWLKYHLYAFPNTPHVTALNRLRFYSELPNTTNSNRFINVFKQSKNIYKWTIRSCSRHEVNNVKH